MNELAFPRGFKALASTVFFALLLLLPTVAAAVTDAVTDAATDVASDRDRNEAAYQFALAKMLAEEAAFDQSLAAFQRAVDLDPDDPYVRLELARFYADLAANAPNRESRFDSLRQAAAESAKAFDRAPNNLDVLRIYAQVHLSLAEVQGTAIDRAQDAFQTLRARTKGDLQVLVSLAQIHLWKREFATAAEVLREAASYRPDNGMISRMLLDALLGSDAIDEAEPLLVAALKENPRSLEHRYTLVDLYNRRGDFASALAVLDAAPDDVQSGLDYNARLVAALHQSGDYARALDVLERLLTTHSLDERLQRFRVMTLSALLRYDDALIALEAWQPEESEAEIERALIESRLLERVGRSHDAAARLRDLAADRAERRDIRLDIGLAGVLERQGALDRAIELLESRTSGAADTPVQLLRTLAELYFRADRIDDSLAMLDRAIAALEAANAGDAAGRLTQRKLSLLIDAERWAALESAAAGLLASPVLEIRTAARIAYAEALARQDHLDSALAALDDADAPDEIARNLLARRVALELNAGREAAAAQRIEAVAASGEADDLFFAAQLWQQAERWPQMVPLLKKALAQEPAAPQALFTLATAYERSGDIAAAVSTFEALLETVPDHAPTLNYLGYMWAERGQQLDRALALIQRAVALDPDNGAYVDSLGWAHFQLGQYDEARRHLEWAARLMADDPTIFEHLGDVYVALDQPQRARTSYQQALTLEAGDSAELRRKLARLAGQGR